MKHNELRNLVLLHLSRIGHLPWAHNTGTGWTGDKMIRQPDGNMLIINPRPFRAGLKGSSDIIACSSVGAFVGCEIKVGRDKMRDDQKDFEKAVNARNGNYHLITDYSWEEDISRIKA